MAALDTVPQKQNLRGVKWEWFMKKVLPKENREGFVRAKQSGPRGQARVWLQVKSRHLPDLKRGLQVKSRGWSCIAWAQVLPMEQGKGRGGREFPGTSDSEPWRQSSSSSPRTAIRGKSQVDLLEAKCTERVREQAVMSPLISWHLQRKSLQRWDIC